MSCHLPPLSFTNLLTSEPTRRYPSLQEVVTVSPTFWPDTTLVAWSGWAGRGHSMRWQEGTGADQTPSPHQMEESWGWRV